MSAAPSAPASVPPPGPGELVMDLILSLDGCAAGEGWPGWWGLQSWSTSTSSSSSPSA